MADEPHAVGDEVGEGGARPGGARRLAGGDDVAPERAGANLGEGGLLHAVDFGQQILKLRVGLAKHAHAGEVADVALEVPAGIDRQHLAGLPGLPEGARLWLARASQAIVELEPAAGLSRRSRSMISALVVPSRAQEMVASIESVMSSDARSSLPSSSGVLIARSRSSTPVASTKRAPSSRSPSIARASEGRKPGSSRCAPAFADALQVLGGERGGIERPRGGGLEAGVQKRPVGVLRPFHGVRHVGGMVGPAALVDHDRQVAAVPDRVHRREEDEA